MKCKNCSNDIKDGNKFCIYCGSSLNENVSVNENMSNSEKEYQPKRKLYYDDNEPRKYVMVGNTKQRKAKRRRSLLISTIIYVCFIVISLFAVKYINSFDYREFIKLGRDEIATIYGLL